ncbi:3-hydroxyacyl-CoA dehydrogenase NAD-binding domain-containing protein [Paraburkholderia pallida]|uniref:3-hydroxyacyl-CoA dehydrogenase n=1 Tax=Paraburkholderia pallida TaxID=2547399 RepID=A0A4P7CYC6_9BURK|nr:3-hydroxyacyl-CoA dehydrogenase NAD-binding domain-containing protein [Paraburkholderia pallida]QBQ99349.1 3-hydroxyacyl-CoA dehydrogenase [Paraburkholderia pallida]
MKTIRYETGADQIVTLTFDDPDAPVNTLSEQWQRDFAEAVERLVAAKETIRGVILASAKSTFVAGADLKAVQEYKAQDMPVVFARIEAAKQNFRRLETLGKPVVACLAGSAVGGGFEIALCAHHRVAVDSPKVQIGLPEATLGLLPAGGGVTKMVRLLGLADALPWLLEGKSMTAAEAARIGLVQRLVDTPDALRQAAVEWIDANPVASQPWDVKGYRMPGGTPSTPKIAGALAVMSAALEQKTRGLMPGPAAILACAVEGAQVDFDTAMRLESRAIVKLFVDPVAQNLVNFFFDRTRIKAGASRPAGVAPQAVAKVGILGAGMMGAGIACVSAMRGMDCVLKDVTPERAESGKAYTRKVTDARVAKGRMTAEQQAQVLARIHATADAQDLQGCDLIIEAVFESRELKAQVTREAEPMLAADGVLASNTSTLPITGLAAASAHPERFIGLHFISPVDKIPLVEIIVGEKTSDATLARAYDYVLQIGKLPIVVNDSRGFYTSRTFGSFVKEGVGMLMEGIPAEVIENAALSAGMPVGPLTVLDETSLSLALSITEQTIADLKAEGRPYLKEPGDLVIEKMVKELGRRGRAGGGGFYDYPEGERKRLWPGLKQHFGRAGVQWDIAELRDRLLFRQSLETLRAMKEGVLRTTHDANVGSVTAIGFPAWTGGTWRFIESQGMERFIARCNELAGRYGERFAPPQA